MSVVSGMAAGAYPRGRHHDPAMSIDRSSRATRSGSARMSIATIRPPLIVKPPTENGRRRAWRRRPTAPLTSAGTHDEAELRRTSAPGRRPPPRRGPRAAAGDRGAEVGAQHDVGVEHGDAAPRSRRRAAAARNASTTSRCASRSASGDACSPWTRRRARLASWRAASGERSTIGAISSKGTREHVVQHEREPLGRAAASRARRAAPARPSRRAAPRARGRCRRRDRRSGRAVRRRAAPRGASCASAACSATRARRRSSASRRGSRSRPRRCGCRRSQASWTASSASLSEPSIR